MIVRVSSVVLLVLVACGDDADPPGTDGGRVDARVGRDSGAMDAALPDAQTMDGARMDAPLLDAPATDASTLDSTVAIDASAPPVCTTFEGFDPLPIVDLATMGQEALASITPSGATILFHRTSTGSCGSFGVFIADDSGGVFDVRDITAALGAAGIDTSRVNALAITSDGLTVIGPTTAGTAFVASSRSSFGVGDFGAGDSTLFVGVGTGGTLGGPAISADSLAFYYLEGSDIYEAVRASPSVPFGGGALMPAAVQAHEYVTATSSDRLSLFLQTDAFSMVMLSRLRIGDPFGGAVSVPGFRTRPLEPCHALIGTCLTGGGCVGEDVCRFAPL